MTTTYKKKKTMSMMIRSSGAGFFRQTSYDKMKEAFGKSKSSKFAQKMKNELTFSGLPDHPGVALLICDPQIDFHAGGKMATKKADDKTKKIANLIRVYGGFIDQIYVTLQQRPSYHIGHPTFWQDHSGNAPEAFVHLDSADLVKRNYLTSRKEHANWAMKYFDELQKKDIHNVIIYPPHCVIGTKGAAIVDTLHQALTEWETKHQKSVHYISKNGNSKTEQYSCFQALVPVKDDESTQMNKGLMSRLLGHDKVLICGYTLSHSVKYSVEDLLANRKTKDAKIFVIEDCCSSLNDFKNGAKHFIDQLKGEAVNGVFVVESTKVSDVLENSTIFQTYSDAAPDLEFDPQSGHFGEGCYLLYDDKNYGSLFTIWSKGQDEAEKQMLQSCIGFFRTGAGAVVPEFKFQGGGQTQLVKEISKGEAHGGRRKKLYAGILRFIQDCRKFRGAFVFPSTTSEEIVDFGLYGLAEDMSIVHVEFDQFIDPTDFSVISCIPKAANAYLGVTKQTKQMFIEKGDRLGATLELK